MEAFVYLIIIVFGILQIILFFKLWGMTNDVKTLKNHFCPEQNKQLTKTPELTKKAIVKSTNAEIGIIRYEFAARQYKCYNFKTKSYEWYGKEELIFENENTKG